MRRIGWKIKMAAWGLMACLGLLAAGPVQADAVDPRREDGLSCQLAYRQEDVAPLEVQQEDGSGSCTAQAETGMLELTLTQDGQPLEELALAQFSQEGLDGMMTLGSSLLLWKDSAGTARVSYWGQGTRGEGQPLLELELTFTEPWGLSSPEPQAQEELSFWRTDGEKLHKTQLLELTQGEGPAALCLSRDGSQALPLRSGTVSIDGTGSVGVSVQEGDTLLVQPNQPGTARVTCWTQQGEQETLAVIVRPVAGSGSRWQPAFPEEGEAWAETLTVPQGWQETRPVCLQAEIECQLQTQPLPEGLSVTGTDRQVFDLRWTEDGWALWINAQEPGEYSLTFYGCPEDGSSREVRWTRRLVVEPAEEGAPQAEMAASASPAGEPARWSGESLWLDAAALSGLTVENYGAPLTLDSAAFSQMDGLLRITVEQQSQVLMQWTFQPQAEGQTGAWCPYGDIDARFPELEERYRLGEYQGISLEHTGPLPLGGAQLQVRCLLPDPGETIFVYRVEDGQLTLTAEVPGEEGEFVAFDLEQGGDYLLTSQPIWKEDEAGLIQSTPSSQTLDWDANVLVTVGEFHQRAQAVSGSEIVLNTSTKYLVSGEVFREAARSYPDKTLVLRGDGYQWEFDLDQLSGLRDLSWFDTRVYASSSVEKGWEQLLGSGQEMLCFAHTGALPGEARLTWYRPSASRLALPYSVWEMGESGPVQREGQLVPRQGRITWTVDHLVDTILTAVPLSVRSQQRLASTEQ